MPNYIPYLTLIFISATLILLTWFRAENIKLIPFYLSTAGIIYLFEYVILVLFKAYKYMPGVFQDDYYDNIFGANVSDGFIVPSTGVFIAVFGLKYRSIIFFTLSLFAVEKWFLHLGIYTHFWWRTIYTGLCLPILFIVCKWLWNEIHFKINHLTLRMFVLYFTDVTIQGTFFFYYAAAFKQIFYHVDWFDDPTRGHIAFATLYIFIRSLFFSLVVALKAKWLYYGLLILAVGSTNFILFEWGILEVPGLWGIGLITVIQSLFLLLLFFIERLLIPENSSFESL